MTTHFTNIPGVFVPIEKTIEGCNAIMNGDYDEYPEQAFYMIGDITQIRKEYSFMLCFFLQKKFNNLLPCCP